MSQLNTSRPEHDISEMEDQTPGAENETPEITEDHLVTKPALEWFFSGFIVALVFGVSLYFIGEEIIEDSLLLFASIIVGLMGALAIFTLFLHVFRDRLYKKAKLRAGATPTVLVNNFSNLLRSIQEKNQQGIKNNTKELTRNLASWYSWIATRRAIWLAAIALTSAFAGFLGASLLQRQNELLIAQTEVSEKQLEFYKNEIEIREKRAIENEKSRLLEIIYGMEKDGNNNLYSKYVEQDRINAAQKYIAMERERIKSKPKDTHHSPNLKRLTFYDADMRNFDFQGVTLIQSNFTKTIFKNADFRRADLTDAEFHGAILENAKFEDAILDGVVFVGANLCGADFSRVKSMKNVDFQFVNNFSSNDYNNLNHPYKKDFRGFEKDAIPECKRTTFEGSTIQKSSFRSANFNRADFSGATLIGVDFNDSCLTKAKFNDATFRADMVFTTKFPNSFNNAIVCETDFTNASFKDVDFRKADLSNSIWQETVGWENILDFKGANIEGLSYAPDGFLDFALKMGAVKSSKNRCGQCGIIDN